MKNRYSTLIAIVVVALVGLFTAGRVEAQLLGPSHTTLQNQHTNQASQHTNLQNQLDAIQSQLGEVPSPWSQDLPVADRFVPVLGNAAVLDKETGLVWEQSPDTTGRLWSGAQFHCNSRSVGNRKGWRLPTVQELASLVDPTNPGGNPDLPLGHPFDNVQSSDYWSATTFAFDASRAWVVGLNVGGVVNGDKSFTRFVWCVRGGHGGPDAQ